MWGLLLNGFGAAIILPIYCFIHLRSSPTKRDNALPLNEAKALAATTALGSLIPLILMLPPLVDCRIEQQQAFIALFQITPLLFVTIQYIAVHLITIFRKNIDHSDADKPFVLQCYIFAGICSATAHVYALAVSLFTRNPATAFSRVYIPSPANVDPSAPSKITEGAHLFLQYDWIIINLTCILYAYLLFEPHLKTRAPFKSYVNVRPDLEKQMALLLIALTTVTLGPGAAVSFAFAAREDGSRKGNLALRRR